MKVERDPEVDTAYIQLAEQITPGAAGSQVEVAAPGGTGKVILDFDANGRLLGIEILGASTVLPAADGSR